MFRSIILAATLAAASLGASAADAPSTITILEGEALIYRDSGRFRAIEGARLEVADIVETGASTFMQAELQGQSVLQLGADSRVMLDGAIVRGRQVRWLYVMNGWVKMTGAPAKEGGAPGYDIRAPLFEIEANAGVVVVKASPAEATIFVERGSVRVAERQARGAPLMVALKAGDYYYRKSGARGVIDRSLARTFVPEIPRPFLDSLPSRIEKFAGTTVRMKEAPPFAYNDVEHWLKAELAVRRQFVRRWRAKSNDPGFRAALVRNLSAHPEWDPILFPEKYLPKDPPPSPQPGQPAGQTQPVEAPSGAAAPQTRPQ